MLEFTLQNTEINHPCLVVKKLISPIILGLDFIQKYEGIIMPKSNKVIFKELNLETPLSQNERSLSAISNAWDELNETETELAREKIFKEYKDVFRPETGKIIGYQHEIKMRSKEPFKAKLYPILEAYKPEIRKQIAELVQQGVIEIAPTQ